MKTEKIQRHHAAIQTRLRHLLERIDALGPSPTNEQRQALKNDAHFLKCEVLPHARGEEKHLYPALEPLLRKYVKPTLFLEREHQMIDAELNYLATELERADNIDQLKRCAIRFASIFQMHTANEEQILFRLAEEHLSEDELDEIARQMRSE
jgi:hemerythrin-like domain-containing protein